MKNFKRFTPMAAADDLALGDDGLPAMTEEERKAAIERGDITDPANDTKTPEEIAAELAAKEAEEKEKGSYDTEDEETADEKAERETAEAKLEREKRMRIPKSRYDEAQAKAAQREAALLEQIETMKKATTVKAANDQVSQFKATIEEMQEKYEDLLMDGNKAEAKVMRVKISTMQEQLSDYRSAQVSESARTQALEQMKYDSALAGLEAQHPELNPDSDDFDNELAGEVADLAEGFIARGYNRAIALTKAAKYVMGPIKKEVAKDEASSVAAKRSEEARKKAADASKRQPPQAATIGKDNDKDGQGPAKGIDVMRMKQDQFKKLDEETLSKLRGDELE